MMYCRNERMKKLNKMKKLKNLRTRNNFLIISFISFFHYIAFSILLTSCFTGVESTPKITYKEVKKQKAQDTPEMHILDAATPERPSDWKLGKRFYIADTRASRGVWHVSPTEMTDSLFGHIAILASVDTVKSLTGEPEISLTLSIPQKSTEIEYRTNLTLSQWNQADTYTLPHVIEMSIIDNAQQAMKGNSYYILQPRRYGIEGNDTTGTRYQPVRVIDVKPNTEAIPLRVWFTDDEGHLASIVMSVVGAAAARRTFDTIFSIDNPRDRYPNITDENWEMIRHGRIILGMTPDECRLALGSPDNLQRIPTSAGMIERWSYNGGIYLQFEDGLLSTFRN